MTLTHIKVPIVRMCLIIFGCGADLNPDLEYATRNAVGPTPLTSSLTEEATAVGGLFYLERGADNC